jgi:hypothetical protein
VYVLDYKEFAFSPYDISTSYNLLMEAIQDRPVAIALFVSGAFQPYDGGVITFEYCDDSNDPDHAVTVVGYGTEDGEDYWLVRNSWGSSWGNQGYFKLERSPTANTCNMFAYKAAYPIVSDTPGSLSTSLHMLLATFSSIVLGVLFML